MCVCVCVCVRIREENSYIKYLFLPELSSAASADMMTSKGDETEEDADRGSQGEKKREWPSERRDSAFTHRPMYECMHPLTSAVTQYSAKESRKYDGSKGIDCAVCCS